jgi:hypothetical protein
MSNEASRFSWRAALWFYLGSVLVALPATLLAGGLAFRAYGAHPRGDAVLYDRDASFLVEWLLREQGLLMPLGLAWVGTLVLAEYGRLLPLGAAFVAVNQDDGQSAYTFGRAVSRIAPHFVRLARWLTLVRLLQLAVVGLAWLAIQGLRGRASTPARDMLCVVPALMAATMTTAIGVAHDGARTALVQGAVRPWGNVLTHRKDLRRAWLFWLLWATLSATLLLCGSQVSRLGPRLLVVAWILHQVLHFARAAVHVGWLGHLGRLWTRAMHAKEAPRWETSP